MRAASCFCFLIAALVSALAGPTNTQTAELAYHSSGTCLASPEGFNSKWEPINSGVTWTTTFASIGRVDAQGAATEVGQAVDTASFGVGPRMHTPAAHSYKVSLTATISKPEKDGSLTFRAGEANGSFTAGPYAGRSLTLSGFQLKRNAAENVEVYGSADTPVMQTLFLGGGVKFERICVLTLSVSPIQGSIR
jgi:hypothetical protein